MIRTLHTYPDGYQLLEPALSPFNRGDLVVIPKGTYVNRMGTKDSHSSKRRAIIKLHRSDDGYLAAHHSYDLVSKRPVLWWAGSGGYWASAALTDQVLEANGLSLRDLQPNEQDSHHNRFNLRYLMEDAP